MVHLIPVDGFAGVETATRSMAERSDLACEYHLVSVMAGSFGVDRPNIHRKGFGNALNPLAQWRAAKFVQSLVPDVLVCSLWKTIPAALLVRLLLLRSCKLVAFIHSAGHAHFLDRWMHKALLAAADAVWADSETSLLRENVHQKGRVISHLVDRPGPMPRRTLRPRFISWGRLHHHKGVDRSIELIAQLVRAGVDATFDIWGPDQGIQHDLETQAARLGVSDRIFFHGPVERSRLREITAHSAFLLQLSRVEGMAMVVAEAMQMGLVPVVTPVGEIPQYCRDGVNSILVDPDNLNLATAKLTALLDDPSKYCTLAKAAQASWAHAPLFSDQMCQAAFDLIERPDEKG